MRYIGSTGYLSEDDLVHLRDEPGEIMIHSAPKVISTTHYVTRSAYDELKAKLASAEYELEQSRKLALMAKVERDTAVSECNMALQALVKMVETRLLASRKAAAEAEAETPGAQMLRAIAVAQKTDRVR